MQTAADFRMAERLRWLACGAAVGAGVSALLAAYLRRRPRRKRIYVSGCFDLLHSGHVAFFKEAAQLGDLYVSVGNDACITQLKKKPMFPENERVYMVASIRWVHCAFVAQGMGHDQAPDLEMVKPDIYFVNEDGDKEIKRKQCAERGIEYRIAARTPDAGLDVRSSTSIKAALG